MLVVGDRMLATLEWILDWEDGQAVHTERYLARRVNFWRDIFPPGMRQALEGLGVGQSACLTYGPGRIAPAYDPALRLRVPKTDVLARVVAGRVVRPRVGRFYPRGLFGPGSGFFPQDARPARVVDQDEAHLLIDVNHPLAGRAVTVTVVVHDLAPKVSDTGGRLYDWIEEIRDYGPGMQTAQAGAWSDYPDGDGSVRADESPDGFFYAAPRLIGHVDRQASRMLTSLYAPRLSAGMRVLDLMSGFVSHLPEDADLTVTGLGLNAVEMAANPRLANHLVHDLNASPRLPFPDAAFDAVVLSLSAEYLVNPLPVFRDCARVVRPGGIMLTGISKRWFPEKCVREWMDLHEFERVGLILDLYRQAGFAEGQFSQSARNWPRPFDDPHIGQTLDSDPVAVIGGIRSGAGRDGSLAEDRLEARARGGGESEREARLAP